MSRYLSRSLQDLTSIHRTLSFNAVYHTAAQYYGPVFYLLNAHTQAHDMARNCCRYFTVSLVPVASLTLAVLFGLAIVALPVLYVELAKEYKVG